MCYSSKYLGGKGGVGLVVSFDGPMQQAVKVDLPRATAKALDAKQDAIRLGVSAADEPRRMRVVRIRHLDDDAPRTDARTHHGVRGRVAFAAAGTPTTSSFSAFHSSRLPASTAAMLVTPVLLPPGRARLVTNPAALICDEPVSALDASLRAQILDLLVRLRADRGLSLLFITHDLLAARYVCERTLVLHRGQVIEQGNTKDVLEHPQHPFTRQLLDSTLTVDPVAARQRRAAAGR